MHSREDIKESEEDYSVATLTIDQEEDCCPTCLEEYTPDNPKIMTECGHHFHLACIYEWSERSNLCPMCSRVSTMNMKLS